MRQLRHFLSVAEARSFSKAAEQCSVTQQAISQSILKLEESLGVRLFSREGGIQLTRFGELLLPHARQVVLELREYRRDLDVELGTASSHVTVGLSPTAAESFVPAAMARLCVERPDISLTVVPGLYEPFCRDLVSGEIDVFVSLMTDRQPDPLISHDEIGRDEYIVVGRARHPLASQTSVTAMDLASYPWISGRNPEEISAGFASVFTEAGLGVPKPHIVTYCVTFSRNYIGSSDSLTILPMRVAQKDIDSGHLARIPFRHPSFERTFVVCYRRKSTRNPIVHGLIDTIKDAAETSLRRVAPKASRTPRVTARSSGRPMKING